jgi:hypothetical protein
VSAQSIVLARWAAGPQRLVLRPLPFGGAADGLCLRPLPYRGCGRRFVFCSSDRGGSLLETRIR